MRYGRYPMIIRKCETISTPAIKGRCTILPVITIVSRRSACCCRPGPIKQEIGIMLQGVKDAPRPSTEPSRPASCNCRPEVRIHEPAKNRSRSGEPVLGWEAGDGVRIVGQKCRCIETRQSAQSRCSSTNGSGSRPRTEVSRRGRGTG